MEEVKVARVGNQVEGEMAMTGGPLVRVLSVFSWVLEIYSGNFGKILAISTLP